MDEGRFDEEEYEYDIVGFRKTWDVCYADDYGSFEEITVPSGRYTFRPAPKYAVCENVLQIFSVKVTQLKEEEGLHWPLHVYGSMATRDSADPRRNLFFHRTRDNCQIVTQEDPFLLLTGPSRAVVLIDPVTFEVELKAKCKTESEDKILNFGVFDYRHQGSLQVPPFITTRSSSCKRSELEFTVALLPRSVEATICVKVIRGSWPDHYRGRVISRTASISHGGVVLLDTRYGKMSVKRYGVVELLRNVVSVESGGQLKVSVVASQVDDEENVIAEGLVDFKPKTAGETFSNCDLGFCLMRFWIHWSLPCSVDENVGLQKHVV
ncbi:unnamed protein product [Urochloa decumbens]|uniref:DUF6598 domain-containing protein n=1 Tax=Urochloa decumbens TaxID=240449 RepID=A0ABC9A4F9_9POAL